MDGFHFQLERQQLPSKPVEGPVGPHLFRASRDVTQDVDLYLTMSPAWSPLQGRAGPVDGVDVFLTTQPEEARIEEIPLEQWTPRHVARWMDASGLEESLVEKFRMHDISGAILMDLQFGDLKELGVRSFGQRHRLWNEVRALRGNDAGQAARHPREESCRPASREEHHAARERRQRFPDDGATPSATGAPVR